jgi:Gas vesicle synthesis protein GvpL/GvpF
VALYIYGIVEPNATVPRMKGIGGGRLGLVAGEDVAVLVSGIDDGRLRFGREAMMVHSRVLERAMSKGTVLPMRFGIVMSGSEEIQSRLLDEHGDELREQLNELAGKVEVRIRATYDEQSLLHEIVRDDPQIATLHAAMRGRSDDATYYARIRLGELVAAAVERRRERDAEAIIDQLASAALAIEPGSASHERIVFQASFLVERDRLARFDRLLEEVASGYGGSIRFKYTGPLPPHSFVQLAERV